MAGWAAVVLAAGRGKRMRSRLPKVLHELCGRRMVCWVIRAARQAGVSSVTVVVPPEHEDFRDVLGNDVHYAVQSDAAGTGPALSAARSGPPARSRRLLVLNGDLPLIRPGTLRRLMTTHEDHGAPLTLATSPEGATEGLARVACDPEGRAVEVIEEPDSEPGQGERQPVNAGAYAMHGGWVWPRLQELPLSSTGERYLTALVGVAAREGNHAATVPVAPEEATGVNTRADMAAAEAALRRRINRGWMEHGVTMKDPETTYVDATVELGADTILHPNTAIRGKTVVGPGSEIGPNAVLAGATVGTGCTIGASVVEDAIMEDEVYVGPFCHLRPGAHLERGVRVGNFAEVKAARLGPRVRMSHFSYVGDAEVGADANIGAGTVTCNFDGVRKHRTVVEEGAQLGSDTMLVAPVTVGARSVTGAGSVVTRDIPPDTLAVGAPARVRPRAPSTAP